MKQIDLVVTFKGPTYKGYSAARSLVAVPLEEIITLTGGCPDTGGSSITTLAFSLPGQAFVEPGRLHIPLPPVTGTILGVAITCHISPAGANLIVDVNKNGTTLFTTQSNRPTIVAGSYGSGWIVPDVTSFDGTTDTLTADVDQTGVGIAGGDIVVGVRFSE